MTQPALKPISRSTVVEAVTDQLRKEILGGSFAAGQKLPAERDLALQLGVNRLTLRAALARLEALGLITTQHGTGSVVRNFRETAGFDTLAGMMRVARDGEAEHYLKLAQDILELRRTLVCETVVLASERRTDEDLVLMRAAAAAQQKRTQNVMAFARGDIEFARIVVRAARNIGLELLLNTLGRFPDDDEELARAMYPRPRAQAKHYDVVIGLIESGVGPVARETMRAALEVIDRATLARLERQVSNGSRGRVSNKVGAP